MACNGVRFCRGNHAYSGKRLPACSKIAGTANPEYSIEAAWAAVNFKHPYWEAEFKRLCQRKLPNKAIGAIARRLLVAVWQVWTKAEADRHAVDVKVARSFLDWGWRLKKAGRKGLTTGEFVREQLDALGLGKDLAEVTRGKKHLLLKQPEPVIQE